MIADKTTETPFKPEYDHILQQIDQVDPLAYAKTRNFRDGAITRLSPYISRGVISTKQVAEAVLSRGYKFYEIEKFIQELAWRDYWQQVWIAKGEAINEDLKHPQQGVTNQEVPEAILEADTGIVAVDQGIKELYETGYMHNHMRMYVAFITCNLAGSHWWEPARWLYYHLWDGDWASNALSWQWVAGANANKKYVANQDNINKFFHSQQRNTFLDVSYEELPDLQTPETLQQTITPELKTDLPPSDELDINPDLPLLLYNYYNMDPQWHRDTNANRILLLEPETFEQYPVSVASLDFLLSLRVNIPGLQVFTGSFAELQQATGATEFIYKEHPLNADYQGREEPRDFIYAVKGYYPSFFSYWKKCKKEQKYGKTAN